MAARTGTRRVSAASARAHTRAKKSTTTFGLPSGVLRKSLLVVLIGILGWCYQFFLPPPPKICGTASGPPITSTRIRLRDGRHLAYKENGVPKEKAKYKIIYIHGFASCRHDTPPISMELAEELGIHFVSFDRPGYGESDPNPKRTEKSIALDVEELADQLGFGSTFYVIGFSMGGQATWGCLKYIPHRLAGATLIAPVVNYWWPSFPANLSSQAYYEQLVQDQWTLRVAHYFPWLAYWWNTQKWFPASSVAARDPRTFYADRELFPKFAKREGYAEQVTQQGEFESLHRDLMVGFGSWEFDPMDLKNPFPNGEGSVHLWHGDKDGLVPILLQRYIANKLSWIHYHDVTGYGHMFPWADGMADAIVRALLLGE